MTKIIPKHKIKYAQQKHNCDCSIACIVMILDFDYDFVLGQFNTDFNKKGITAEDVRKYITYNGLSCIEKRTFGFEQILTINKQLLKPFADIHYVSFAQFSNIKTNHAVVMDYKGKIYDPGLKERTKLYFGDYFEIETVMGFYYPSKTRTIVKRKNNATKISIR